MPRISDNLDWHQTYSVIQDNFEVLILLPCSEIALMYITFSCEGLGIEPMDLCTLAKLSTAELCPQAWKPVFDCLVKYFSGFMHSVLIVSKSLGTYLGEMDI